MDDALGVRRLERVGDLVGDAERLLERHRALRDAIGERRSLDEFHDQGRRAPGSFQAENVRDVGIVEGGEDFGLALESREPLRVAGHRRRQYLDRDLPLEARVGGAIDLAHAAFAEQTENLVGPETLTGGEGHGDGIIADKLRHLYPRQSMRISSGRSPRWTLLWPQLDDRHPHHVERRAGSLTRLLPRSSSEFDASSTTSSVIRF
jgi:hypothetical protein